MSHGTHGVPSSERPYQPKLCPICRSNSADSLHHITPRSEGGKDERRNLIWLCKRCHDSVEEQHASLSPASVADLRRALEIDEDTGDENIFLCGKNGRLWTTVKHKPLGKPPTYEKIGIWIPYDDTAGIEIGVNKTEW